MLHDLMQHIANSYVQTQGFDRLKTLDRIKAGFFAEDESATDNPSGRVEEN